MVQIVVDQTDVYKTSLQIPRFDKVQLHTKMAHQDIGDAFQIFIHELLLFDYPDLHLFPGKGKDGGIDLSCTMDTSRTVVECKYIGNDGFEDANKVWKKVASKFEKHLVDSCGPTKGQSQYEPWYSTNPPISKYIFCISSVLNNQNQADKLKPEIVNFFAALIDKHEHLKHLTGISVEVLDWEYLRSRLQQHPHLIFRWFPRTRPQGLVPIDDLPHEGTFRSYLTSEKLAYYSLGQHLKTNPAPMGMDVPDEENLLNQLESGETTGLMVTGSGGIGKSRLTLEIGRLAHHKDWLVFRVQTRLKEKTLEDLAERIAPDARVLLLIDYIETQRDFVELVETLNDLNDTYSLNLRYIANCRTSFYQTVDATSRHKRVNLTPTVQDSGLYWFKEYRLQIVRHILEQSGLEVTEDHMAVCHDIPTLAVFISYLHNVGRQTELSELLKEADFGTWIAKRVQLSFGEKDIRRDLALLIAQFPMPLDTVYHHNQQNQGALFDTLAADGWIEKLPADELHEVGMWVTVHDVLADQILLSYFRSIPHTIERFLDELLFQASKIECLRSTILTLQRLIDQPELSSLNWLNILGMKIADDMSAWREVRYMLIRTSLLTPLETIALLSKYEEFWDDVETEMDFQNALGWYIRWGMKQGESELNSENRSTLNSWLGKTSLCAIKNNFILTWGLRFNPESVCKPALEWIRSNPVQFQTHYLLVAWMECHLPLDYIIFSVQQWTAKFANVPHLSFVAKAWLDAGGKKELVQDPIRVWLEEHLFDPKAHFVYKAWLDAGGKKELVQDPIRVWLEEHLADPKAHFVYKAWLDKDGEKELVQDPIRVWLEEHLVDLEAGFVYKAWLDTGGEKELVQDPIKGWLEEHLADLEAGFVYEAWLDAGGEKEFVRNPIKGWLEEHLADSEAGFVYEAWLDAGGEKELVRDPIKGWLKKHKAGPKADFVYKAWLDAGGEKELVQDPIRAWLEKHKVDLEAGFVYKAWLDAGGKKELVQDPIRVWLEEHLADPKAHFVYKAWLDAGGENELVRDPIKGWLEEHLADSEAGFVYKVWLDANGEKELVRASIKGWLEEHLADLEAGFVYEAWLDAGGEKELVRDSIKGWLEEHKADPKADFVYKAWLDAGGEKELVRDPIKGWLEKHKADPEAGFVYKAWLDAGGEKELVRDSIKGWLAEHKADPKADFVYKAWLDASGEFSVVRSSAILWLHHNYDKLEAVYLTKFLAKQRDIPIETVKDILMWCHKFPDNKDALWRLTQLGKHLLRGEVGEELITTSKNVLNPQILLDFQPSTLIRGQINTLFSYLIGAPGLRSGQLRNQVDSLLLTWVKNPSSYGNNPKPHFTIQRSEYVHRIIDLLDTGKLTISKDRESLERFLFWIDSWDLDRKSRLYKEIAYLKENYPTPELWDILVIK